ncbi:MAG: metal ABC transporter permease [Lachnospiraceae bacterium]|nr:metal ABC transporter permease [Lachnospiraceae bacterium]
MLETLSIYLSYEFVRRALIVGVLIALCASLIGVTLVLKRYSYIGDGLSHVAFGVMALATVLRLANVNVLVMPVIIVVAVILLRGNKRVKGDSAIAMLSVGSLAIGYMLMNVFSVSANVSGDVCSTLFGSISILTVSKAELITCIVVSVVVVVVFILFYNRIFAVTFDENFAKATGVKADRYNLMVSVMIAIVIVLGMNLVGSLLISALIVFPALTAMRIVDNFRAVTICCAIIAVVCAVAGMLLSILYSTPVGSTIVVVNIVVFVLAQIVGAIKNGK